MQISYARVLLEKFLSFVFFSNMPKGKETYEKFPEQSSMKICFAAINSSQRA